VAEKERWQNYGATLVCVSRVSVGHCRTIFQPGFRSGEYLLESVSLVFDESLESLVSLVSLVSSDKVDGSQVAHFLNWTPIFEQYVVW
jgi:hypothetical protein